MKTLLAASVAAPALLLAASAWAQAYPEPYPPSSYDQGYAPDDQGYMPDQGQAYDDADAMDDADDDAYAGPDYSQAYPDADDDDAYPADTYGSGYGDQGAPQYQPYESVPPTYAPAPSHSYGYSYNSPQRMTPAQPMETGVPSDLVDREDSLEARIRSGETRGLVPSFHVDNLMVQLDSIRAQQEQLAARDGGLDQTTRTFIESRLTRLERNVTW